MYNTLIYGNGMTLAVIEKIKETKTYQSSDKNIDFNIFLKKILDFEDGRVKRNFDNLFLGKNNVNNHKIEMLYYINSNYDEISSIGFERWVSIHLFDEKDIPHNAKFLNHIFYNYWYSFINDDVLYAWDVKNVIKDFSAKILSKLVKDKHIYTTNFDMILDKYLFPQHIHGRFHTPLKYIEDIILKESISQKSFEYKFLFGTNGLEKLSRLSNLRCYNSIYYDLDFFFNTPYLGDVLVYGLSFGRSEVISDKILAEHPEKVDMNLLKSVDGHIIEKLESLFKMNMIKSISICYYSEQDIENIKNVFSETEIIRHVKFVNCKAIF